MFANVLKKFFTNAAINENKLGTRRERERRATMFKQIRAVVMRSQDTLIYDALGAVALMTTLVVGLYLPGLA